MREGIVMALALHPFPQFVQERDLVGLNPDSNVIEFPRLVVTGFIDVTSFQVGVKALPRHVQYGPRPDVDATLKQKKVESFQGSRRQVFLFQIPLQHLNHLLLPLCDLLQTGDPGELVFLIFFGTTRKIWRKFSSRVSQRLLHDGKAESLFHLPFLVRVAVVKKNFQLGHVPIGCAWLPLSSELNSRKKMQNLEHFLTNRSLCG